MENSAPARFVKLRGKTSIVEFKFIKVVGQKSDAVINIELLLNVYLWDCGLRFPIENLGGKSNIR